jgi:hypothetical protein
MFISSFCFRIRLSEPTVAQSGRSERRPARTIRLIYDMCSARSSALA